MPGELHELSVAIGELQKGMSVLEDAVRENQEKSTAEHREVHDIVTAMAESVRNIAKDVAQMKPLTEDYREKRAEARGARRFLNAAYALGGGTVAMIGSELVKWFMARPHP